MDHGFLEGLWGSPPWGLLGGKGGGLGIRQVSSHPAAFIQSPLLCRHLLGFKVFDQMVLWVGRACWEVMGETLGRTSVGPSISWSGTLPLPSQYYPLPSSCGEKMDGGARAGTDHSGMMDFVPNQKPSGSSGVMSRGERSPSQGRWVSKGQGHRVGREVQGLVCTPSLEAL